MLVLRIEQMKAFDPLGRTAFEHEMVVHAKEFTPLLCNVLGDEQLRIALRRALDGAERHGLTYRGPMRLYVELAFLFGSGFDTDPQYPWAADALHAAGDQMDRAEQLFARTVEYQEQVSGSAAVNTRRALTALAAVAGDLTFSLDYLPAELLREMERIFPEKAAYVGTPGLTTLIEEGRARAREYDLPGPRGDALIVVLMFAFGHGCPDDPLYPWIARTLRDPRIVQPAARVDRLERKALTWLDHVLGRPARNTDA